MEFPSKSFYILVILDVFSRNTKTYLLRCIKTKDFIQGLEQCFLKKYQTRLQS